MKEKFTRNMGYVIVLFVIAIYFVISYLFVEGKTLEDEIMCQLEDLKYGD
jgi:uncharacterized membrane protein affecting hemolysin expression